MDLVKQNDEFKSLCDTPKNRVKFSMTNIYLSEYEKIISTELRKNIKCKMKLGKLDFEIPEKLHNPKNYLELLYKENFEMSEEIKKGEAEEKKAYYFVTISPKPGIQVNHFLTLLDDITKWKPLIEGCYVIEQRGECASTNGDGLHAHICILDHTIEHQRLIKRLTDKFSPICEPIYIKKKPSYKHCINVKRKNKDHILETRDKYLTGDKETEKLLKTKQDIVFREKHQLKDFYSWDTTTDESIPTKTDPQGRVYKECRGGKRTGAGRPKGSPNKPGYKKPGRKPKPTTNDMEIKYENKITELTF